MPDYSSPPTALDVEVLLKSASFWPTDAVKIALAQEQAAIGANAAVAEWESRTGWKPFLSPNGAADVTRYYGETDAKGNLDFSAGLLTCTSVTVSGAAQAVNTNYWLTPANAAADGRPYTGLRFNHRVGTVLYVHPNAIAVTGRWGYCTTMPADAWQAIQQAAALMALTGVENLQSIASLSMDGFSKAFDVVGIITQKDLMSQWGKNFGQQAMRYVRVVV